MGTGPVVLVTDSSTETTKHLAVDKAARSTYSAHH